MTRDECSLLIYPPPVSLSDDILDRRSILLNMVAPDKSGHQVVYAWQWVSVLDTLLVQCSGSRCTFA